MLCNESNVISNIISFSLILSPSYHLDPKPTPLPVRNYAKCNFDLINFDLEAKFNNCDTVDDFWSTFLNFIDVM